MRVCALGASELILSTKGMKSMNCQLLSATDMQRIENKIFLNQSQFYCLYLTAVDGMQG